MLQSYDKYAIIYMFEIVPTMTGDKMIRSIWQSLIDLAHYYRVNPLIFVTLYLVSWPQVWLSWYLLVKAHSLGSERKFKRALLYNRLVTFLPYLYILLFGRNFPLWLIITSLLFMAVMSIIFRYKLGRGLLNNLGRKVEPLKQKLTRIVQNFEQKNCYSNYESRKK